MRKMNDLMYPRRGFGSHARPEPMMNKSPGVPIAPQRSHKTKTLMQQSLLKGNSIQSNGVKSKPAEGTWTFNYEIYL